MGGLTMSRPKSPIFAFSVFSFALLLVIALAAPNPAFAQLEGMQELELTPSTLSFGNVSVGTTSPSQTDTVTNQFDDDTVGIISVFVSPDFVLTANTCGRVLAPLQTCQIEVACKPTNTGPIRGGLVFVTNSKETSGPTDSDDTVDFSTLGFEVVMLTCTGVSGATPTPTTTATATNTATATATSTATATATATPTPTLTATATATSTATSTATATATATDTATATATS